MDQIRIGAFLKALRKEKGLTQEQLAEKLAVSGRTVSRWETGSNMPDIGMLVVLADFYGVSIPELIIGERKSENMNQETRDTAIAMAEYSQVTAKSSRRKVIGILFITFGLFIIISALSIFPSESSWGSIYATLGSIILIAGIYLIIRQLVAKRAVRLSLVFGCAVLLFGAFTLSDYIAVTQFIRCRASATKQFTIPASRINWCTKPCSSPPSSKILAPRRNGSISQNKAP